MSRFWITVLAFAVAGAAADASARSELVIVKDGTREYHRPACPVIRDARDVMAMTRAQAESRGYKAHPACDPANAPSEQRPPSQPSPPVFVYTSSGDNKYHRENCSKLATERRKITLEEAAAGRLWPCPVCKPPIRKKGEPIVPPRSSRG